MYELGYGVKKKDLVHAVHWYRKAAAQNEPDALLHLKLIETIDVGQVVKTLDGRSTSDDNDDDLSFYGSDHCGDHADATAADDHDEMDIDENNASLIVKYREAAEDGDPAGQYNL
ncbi:hypothetical protein BGZ73_002438, partial [Actinomortierella ambigua]